MHFKTVERDEVLPMLDQAKDKKGQKEILCDLLDCTKKELDVLISELETEKAARSSDYPALKKGSYSEDELEAMRAMLKEGKSTGYIAGKLGRPAKNVGMKLADIRRELEAASEADLCDRIAANPAPASVPKDGIFHAEEIASAGDGTNEQIEDITAYARELESALAEKEKALWKAEHDVLKLGSELTLLKAELEKERDRSSVIEDGFAEEIEEAWREAEAGTKAKKEAEEKLKETRELLMKYDRKQMLLSAALAKSLEFIASLNGVIADVLKR